MHIALINTNRMQPPIAPIGLDYVAEALGAAGHSIELLDLAWEENPQASIESFFAKASYQLVGMTLRNTDDCSFIDCQTFIPGFVELAKCVRKSTDAPIVIGGVGFSVMPEQILSMTESALGIWGEGEFTIVDLANRLETGREWRDLPSLVWPDGRQWRRNPPQWRSLAELPAMTRGWIDNRRYFREGGQAGFETKRGCSADCIYCADPAAKGKTVRLRPPAAVAAELKCLVDLGITALHTCDGEFNVPAWHALEVCREIIRRGLGSKMRWYAYCSPAGFSKELAAAMRHAGCVGIDFGADNGSEAMLKSLGRNFSPEDILNCTRWTKQEGMAVMLDLLLGGPGETRGSLEQTVALMKNADPERVGVTLGVRIYPGTVLAARMGEGDPLKPSFFLEPAIASCIFELLGERIGDDRRFLFLDPSKPDQNYNYNSNQRLVDAIQKGHRGAFWDILRTYNPPA